MDKWARFTVSEIADKKRNAIVGGPFGSDLVSKDYTACGVPVIRGVNMGGGRWVDGDFVYVSEEKALSLAANCAKPGDLVFTQRGTIGQVALVPQNEFIKYLISQSQMKLSVDSDKADSLFLYYIFIGKQQQKYIQQNAIRTGVPHTNLGILRDTPLILPPLTTQKKISSFLNAIDSKIELNNKINAELEVMAKLIYDYWFVQFDFPNADGKPYKSLGGKMVYNEELKREIPEDWEIKELDTIANCIMGQSPKGDTYNNEGVGTALLNGPADYKNGALFGRTYTTAPTRLCQKSDMVLCIRATIGNLVYSEGQYCLGRGVAAVRPNDKTNSELIYFLILQEIQRFKVQATGSIIKGITKDDLAKSKCLIPSKELAVRFHEIINPMFDKIRKNKEETLKMIELRDWLLPMLMNGQVSLKNA